MCMLKIENLIEINKNFSNGEIDKIDNLNSTILKINNSNNWIGQISLLLKALLSENCFKECNKETACALMLAAFEIKNVAINQDNVLNLILAISKNRISDIRRINRMVKEVVQVFTENYFNIARNIIVKYPEIFNNLKLYKEHKKLKKIDHKMRVNMTIDPVLYHKFKKYCSLNGMKVSARVEQLMRKELQNQALLKLVVKSMARYSPLYG